MSEQAKSSPSQPTEKRKLVTIQIEMRFAGYFPVLKFADGTLENVGPHVHQTAESALHAAKEYIAKPCYNIQWWNGRSC